MIIMKWDFEKAEAKDFNRINELFIEMLQTIYNTNEVNGYSEGDLDKYFNGGDDWICKGTYDSVIIAFISIEVHRENENFVYLDDLSVSQMYRNNMIGTSLINRAEEYAKEIKFDHVYLHVEKSNAGALQLYQRLGYSIHEDQEHRYLMRKDL